MTAKILPFAAVLFACASNGAFAQGSLEPVVVRDDVSFTVDCRDERLPSLRAVGDALETNNAAYMYDQRERLAHTAHRACLRGAGNVAFVRDESTAPASLALAIATK